MRWSIIAALHRGAVSSRSIAISTAKALMKRSPKLIGLICLNKPSWAQSLFKRINFKQGRATTCKPEIPEGTKKQAELSFIHLAVQKANLFWSF